MREIVDPAIDQLCRAFDRGGYNPSPIVDLGVLVASAGGKVSMREREVLLDVFQTLLDTTLTPELVDHLVTASLDVIEAAGAEPRARLVAAILADCDAVEPGIRVALAIAFASEGLSTAERAVIYRIAGAAGLAPSRVEALIEEVRAHVDGDPVSVRMALSPKSPPSTR
ncbi:MAG: TerB family tellurite resistance protein [Labilithrix sp.]|nr:TerB family tellurite resistance protein [Labilithrix sp.]